MPVAGGEIFEFGDFTLDPAERLLLLRGQPLHLTPKTFDLLVVLVRHGGSLMPKDRLIDAVWPKVFVAEVNLEGRPFDQGELVALIPALAYQ